MIGGLSSTSQMSRDSSQTDAPPPVVVVGPLVAAGPVTSQSVSSRNRCAAGGGLALAALGLVTLGVKGSPSMLSRPPLWTPLDLWPLGVCSGSIRRFGLVHCVRELVVYRGTKHGLVNNEI